MKKREKKKRLEKLMEELAQIEFKDDIDYDAKEPVDEELYKRLRKKEFLDVEDLKQINPDHISGPFEKPVYEEEDTAYNLHRKRTKKNVEEYLPHLIYMNKQSK